MTTIPRLLHLILHNQESCVDERLVLLAFHIVWNIMFSIFVLLKLKIKSYNSSKIETKKDSKVNISKTKKEQKNVMYNSNFT